MKRQYLFFYMLRFDNLTLTANFSLSAPPLLVSLQPNSSFIRVERGSSMTLFCNSSGCPHSHITWKNETHQPSLSRTADSEAFVSQLGPWTIGLEDNRMFICEVQCGSVVKSKHTEIKVYCKYHSRFTYLLYTDFKH